MAKKKQPAAASVPVDAHKHVADTRPNIPTRETAAFAADDAPQTFVAHRDRSLDPQLVWKGKDEQDAKPLEVPAVALHVQEKVHPQAIVEDVKARAKQGKPVYDLFADFNGIADMSKKLEFYQHSQHWTNRLILGDSLLVMASLAEKEHLRGTVQCVYFDPPYGIKFGSNWQVSTRKRDVKDAKAEDLTRQPEQIKAFRDTWELGIHSYLSYMRDRLTAARDLLTESGSIFVQIGDENVHLVRGLLDEVFGSGNFISQITAVKTSGASSELLPGVSDTVLFYGKQREMTKYRQLYTEKRLGEDGTTQYIWIMSKDGTDKRRMTREDRTALDTIQQRYDVYAADNLTSQRPPGDFPVTVGARTFRPGKGYWKTHLEGFKRLEIAGRLEPIGNTLMYRRFLKDFAVSPITNIWRDVLMTGFSEDKVYVVQTSSKIIERCILMTTDPGDLVLDPTCGSGTTAYVAEQWGRRWITIDTSRVALALARTRLMAARFPYYLLADSPEGRKKQSELTGTPFDPAPAPQHDLHKGFVYRTVPHVTLRSIANNPDIDAIHASTAPVFAELLKELNKELKTNWSEWEVPSLPESGWTAANDVLEAWAAKAKKALKDWSKQARALLDRWWNERAAQRARIDQAIAKHADSETLYDQPYENKDVVRLTGPFTVESLSPHRALPTDAPAPVAEPKGAKEPRSPETFLSMILENLRKAGVKGTDKSQRITFARLDTFAGQYVHAEGETETGVSVRVSVGPEFGTVGDEHIKKAAIEAIKGSKCDLLLVCAFAFEAGVHDQTAELTKEIKFGKLNVLPVRMNPDLAMGDELLKKTGSGNLFTVFGEPDVKIDTKAGKVTVTVRGVDVFDPSTGAVRTGDTDDIACWFIDTDYDGQSFFVRHAYFLYGGKDTKEGPYDKLKKALRAEIDESEWSKLYSATSQPFDPPSTGNIAVKVINHFGDEVLKVYPVPSKAASK